MQWQIGDKIVHPVHGAGVIKSTSTLTLEGEAREYYVVEFPAIKMRVHIAFNEIETLRLRHVISKTELTHIVAILQQKPEPLPAAATARQMLVEASLHETRTETLAQVVRDLGAFLNNQHVVRERDRRLWDRAVMLLAMEWALASDCSIETARAQVQRLAQAPAATRKKV